MEGSRLASAASMALARWSPLVCCLVVLASAASAGPLIVVDPGHGGSQAGAESPHGALEKQVALDIALKLKDALVRKLHATVRLTRERDVPVHLSERVDWANRQSPALFISVHLNSMPTKKQRELTEGIETYFLSASASGEQAKKVAARENAEVSQRVKRGGDTLSFILADLQRSEAHADSSRLAYAVHEQLVAETGAIDRGVQQAPFFVLMGLQSPAILVEAGFLSHPDESEKLLDGEYQMRLAEAIAAGAEQFLSTVSRRDGRQERTER